METITKPLISLGWVRALLYTVAMFATLILLGIAGTFIALQLGLAPKTGEESSLENFLLSYSTISIGTLLITWLFRKFIDRQTFRSLGFAWSEYKNEAWMGFFTATTILSVGSLILVVAGYLTFIGIEFSTYHIGMELLALLIVAFIEELLFRGYLLNNLLQSTNKWIALLITAILFSLFHGANPGVSMLSLLNIFAAGMLLGINYIYTRNLWFSIFLHFAWNFFQGPVLGYDVSGLEMQSIFKQSLNGPALFTGGPFGFEGSLLCLMLVMIATLIFGYFFSKRYEPVAELA